MTRPTVEELEAGLPDEYPVSIILERRLSNSRWSEESWEAVGITPGNGADEQDATPVKIREGREATQYLFRGFVLRLHRDECESYYHNLMTPHPRCYVVARQEDEEAMPVPFLVSMSFDEAHAYLEAGDPIYAVDIPPELYRWCETFVLAHYVPQKKYKRKLTSWKEGGR